MKHADAESRTQFVGLDYWPAKEDWRIEGRFIPHPPGKTLTIVDVIGVDANRLLNVKSITVVE